ncbi:hypothetical protein [Aquimarina algicola]|uniref:Protease complex subunit PrcB family protein n=1 Tax=Aquimarina algicola TaxID=2589995 RepID=A0A504JGD6_9FLAO|nr:hypothetical protein [Aquimarina algicola]TPN86818.1 hypothetical protein FHK87_04225 [Aquimarina algicola]
MKNNFLIILLSIFALSCSSDDKNLEMTDVESIVIAKDNLYGNGEEGIMKQNLIISDQATWNDLITKMNSVNNVSDNFTEIDIDFSEYTVIAVFDTIKGNGGYSLKLDITSNSENVIVNVTSFVLEGGGATTVITQSFNIIKIHNSDLPIIFK